MWDSGKAWVLGMELNIKRNEYESYESQFSKMYGNFFEF